LHPLLEDELWNFPASQARQQLAKALLLIAEGERRRNTRMARLLQAAIILEIVGIAFVALSIIVFIAAG
jgi:hypothetical protein